MNWFSQEGKPLPAVIEKICLPVGTVVSEQYSITSAKYVNGLELVYEAEDTDAKEKVQLCEFLPLRWCMRSESLEWTPYHAAASMELERVTSMLLQRLEKLQTMEEEAALLSVSASFRALGTVWYVVPAGEETCFSAIQQSKLFTAQEAIALLAPVLDTLAGLHQAGLFHGGITEHVLMQRKEQLYLTGWCLSAEQKTENLSAVEDVRAISTLLCRMMTGESEYRKDACCEVPKAIGSVLQRGIRGEIPDIETLWKALHPPHSVRIPKKKEPKQAEAPRSLFNLPFAICFAAVCCAIPVLVFFLHTRSAPLTDTAYATKDEEIHMPELLYLPQEEAIAAAEACGLHVIVEARVDNPTVPVDHVVTQYPAAGSILYPGDTIRISISDGWSNYVPDVHNLLLEQALEKLEKEGFIVEYEEVFSADHAPGTVISQDIEPDTLLERDSVIRLTVSLGREDLDTSKLETVDDYVGMDFEEAKALLSELHLYALQLEAVYDPEIPAGVIISQDIPKGEKVPQGTVINMVVSLGVEMTRVPSVGMMNASSARVLLEEAGLKAVLVYTANSGYARDCVISQSVAAGQQLPVGSEVWLTVSLGQDSYVVSTGGWSGNTLPEGDTTEPTDPDATSELTTDPTEMTEETMTTDETTPEGTMESTESLPTESGEVSTSDASEAVTETEEALPTDPTEPQASETEPETIPPTEAVIPTEPQPDAPTEAP